MARPLRLSFENAVYHITARGNRKEEIFYSDDDRRSFLEKMEETWGKYSIVCYAYCLMSNHYHLFIKTPLANISEAMHYLNASYANWFRVRHGIVGAVFQGRYRSIIVDEDRYAVQLSAYIHANPVRAGMVKDPLEYPWSSYPEYMGRRNPLARLETGFILGQFDDDLRRARRRYRAYVIRNLYAKDPVKEAYKGVALGGEGFIESIKERMRSIGRSREIAATRDAETYTAEEIIQQVMERASVSRDEIFDRRRGNIYRQMTLYLLKRYTPMSLREIGEMFGMDYAAVSQACRRYEERIRGG